MPSPERLDAVIFDLDQTLIASSAAAVHRKQREWQKVYQLVPTMTPYVGAVELLNELRARGCKIAIVTSSPRSYFSRIVNYWSLTHDASVCFHDVVRAEQKPHPRQMLLALERLGVAPQFAIAIGDTRSDTEAARAAGIISVGAAWDCADRSQLEASIPDLLFDRVADLRSYLSTIP